ncbi:MAG TPA: AraC family transcriptional regulator [Vicinamibacteria bacterium]
MNRVVQLVHTDAVTLRYFDHVPDVAHQDPERECASRHAVSFVEAGSFRVRTTGPWHEVTTDSLFVTTPGLEFTCAHDEDHPRDRCLSVSYSEEAVESARSCMVLGHSSVRPLSNRHAFLQRALRECAPGDEARTEALAVALLWSLSEAPRRPLFRPERLAWYAARVERAKAMVEARYSQPLSLSTLARDAGMSVFHFARIFTELEGRPPHRFLTDVRLSHARARLLEGGGVTDTCFAVGFGSLSHFVTTFRRRYGAKPSSLRRSPGAAEPRGRGPNRPDLRTK